MIAWGIGHIDSELYDWQYLFIILGVITSTWGILMLFLLPDSPGTAHFLTPDERTAAVERVRENRTAVSTGDFKMAQAMEAFRDPQAWLLCINMFGSMLVNSGLSAVRVPTTLYVSQLTGYSSRVLSLLALDIQGYRLFSIKCPSVPLKSGWSSYHLYVEVTSRGRVQFSWPHSVC